MQGFVALATNIEISNLTMPCIVGHLPGIIHTIPLVLCSSNRRSTVLLIYCLLFSRNQLPSIDIQSVFYPRWQMGHLWPSISYPFKSIAAWWDCSILQVRTKSDLKDRKYLRTRVDAYLSKYIHGQDLRRRGG
jgi:hypothetical protein